MYNNSNKKLEHVEHEQKKPLNHAGFGAFHANKITLNNVEHTLNNVSEIGQPCALWRFVP